MIEPGAGHPLPHGTQSTASEMQDVIALRYLIEVVDSGSFSGAARRLGLNPSTLTRRITRIEDQLGLTLLERNRSGVQITSGGRAVISQVRRALQELAAIREMAHANGVGHSGELRIGTRLPITSGPMLEILAAWREAHPGVLLRISEMNDDELRNALVERRLDAAFIVRHAMWPTSAYLPVFQESIAAAIPSRHDLAGFEALTWDHLRTQRFLTQGWHDSQTAREFFASLLGSGVEFISHATSKQSILSLVAAGFGVTLCVESQAALSWPGVVFRPISESNARVEVNLVWLAEREDAAAGLFVAFVRDWAASWMRELSARAGPQEEGRNTLPLQRSDGSSHLKQSRNPK